MCVCVCVWVRACVHFLGCFFFFFNWDFPTQRLKKNNNNYVIAVLLCRRVKFAMTPPPVCSLGMRINLGWVFLRNKRFIKISSSLPLHCLKELRWRACCQNRATTRAVCKEHGFTLFGETERGLKIRVSHSLHGPGNLFTKHLLFHLHVICLPLLGSPNPPTSNILFCLCWGWYLRWGLGPLGELASSSGSLPRTHY